MVPLSLVVQGLLAGITPTKANGESHQAALQRFFQAIGSHPQINGAGTGQLLALAGPADALVLIDRALARQ